MSTIKDKIHFTYNGKSTRDFGILSANLDGGMYEESFVAEQSIREEKLVDRRTTIFSGVEKEPLEFQLVLAFENNFTDETIEEVVEWLYGTEYYSKLEFEGIDRVYYCMPSGESTITHTGYKEGYITLNMRSNSPYVFGKMIEATRDDELFQAWANSEDGTKDFTMVYPRENLALNTIDMRKGWTPSWNKTLVERTETEDGIKIRTINDYQTGVGEPIDILPKKGEIYILSLIARGTGLIEPYFISTKNGNQAFGQKRPKSETEWEEITFSIKVDRNFTEVDNFSLLTRLSQWFEVKNGSVKLERINDSSNMYKTIYLPSPKEDSERYPMKFRGESKNKDSKLPSDFNWTSSNSKEISIKLKGKIDPEVLIKIKQKSVGYVELNMNGNTVRINNLLKDETIKILPNEEDIESDRINTYHYNDYIGDLSNLGLLQKENVLKIVGDCDIEYYYQPYYNK